MIVKSKSIDLQARVCLLFFAFAMLLCSGRALLAADSEAGAFFLEQYSPKTYSANPQNWAVAQDRRGVMYVGNTEGILEYDGATWRKILIGDSRPGWSLAVTKNGTVFVGSENEFGFLKPDAQGVLQYHSLVAQVPSANRKFGFIWSMAESPSGVWFQSTRCLFHWSAQHGISVVSGQSYGRLFSVADRIYLAVRRSGLYRLQDSGLVAVPGARVPGDSAVQGIFAFHNAIVIATPDGFFDLTQTGLQKRPTPMMEQLKQAGAKSFLPLRNGYLAIGTVRRGLLLMNHDGSLSRVISKEQGLRSEVVNSMQEDAQGGVWLALDRGLARVDVDQRLTTFGEREGVSEMVLSLERQANTLYAGSAVGLSYLVPSANGQPPYFTAVNGVHLTIIVMLPTRFGLIAGGTSGIWEVHGDQAVAFVSPARVIYDLAASPRHDDLLYAAGRDGLYIFQRRQSGWNLVREIGAEGSEFRNVLEASDGKLWVTTRSAIFRIDLTSEKDQVKRFTMKEGVPAGWNNVYRVGNRIVFATSKGLRRFDENTQTFARENSFGQMFSDGSHPVSRIAQSASGDIWISGEGYEGVLLKRQGGYDWRPNVLGRASISEVYAFHLDTDGTAWASGMDGELARYKASSYPVAPVAPVLLRHVELLNSSHLVSGEGPTSSKQLGFRYADNALRFGFALPNFGDEAETQYQVFLQGLDHGWSPWATETQKDYTNLFEKAYTFKVRARDIEGRISPEATFKFHIRAPWYRTWWAYLLDAVLFSAAVVLFIRWRLAHLHFKNRKLELIVEERTRRIRKQRDEIQAQEIQTEKLLLNILPLPVANELRTTGSVQPLLFNNVAVCFTDFVGFTLSSEQMSAPDLVRRLDRYFTAFDEVIGRYGLEKLKTIGDAYMFVGGLPVPKDSYAVDTVLAALELVQIVEDFHREDPSASWEIRIGVHCGPVIAGVVGVKKFAFDVWGETVNRASRMESCSKPNRVNVSQETYNQIKDILSCEARGPIGTKEGRAFDMYFVSRSEMTYPDDHSMFSERYAKSFGANPPQRRSASTAETGSPVLVSSQRSVAGDSEQNQQTEAHEK